MKSVVSPSIRWETMASDLGLLVKARLSLLVVFTTLVGFLSENGNGSGLLIATLIGTAFSACGAAALNQWWEKDLDARMARTRHRPLPAGRLHPSDALLMGILFSLTGIAILFLFVNKLSALLAALTIASYIFFYTPMKRISDLNTLVGAVPGALPPLIGCTAARDEVVLSGWILFAILWFWQMPHFLAIAWMYRAQYVAAGFVMLSKNDDSGKKTSRQALVYTAFLLPVSLLPVAAGLNSLTYLIGTFLLSSVFLVQAIAFERRCSMVRARALFFTSIIYLPLLLGLLVATKR